MKLSLSFIHVRIIILACASLICTDITLAQQDNAPTMVAQRSLGSTSDDEFRSMSLTGDGGCILAGFASAANGDVTTNLGQKDFWIVKLDSTLEMQWNQVVGGSGVDWARHVKPSHDSGYIVLGYSNSTDGHVTGNKGSFDYWLVKLDLHGNLQWQKTMGGSKEDNGYTVVETNDGGYICAGYSFSSDGDVSENHGQDDGWVVKLDAARNIQWQRSLGGSKSDEFDDVILTADGGYLLVGYAGFNDGDVTISYGSRDVWVVKLDANGNLVWEKSYGGSKYDSGRKGIQTKDGGFIIAGLSSSDNGTATTNKGKSDFWILRLDMNGTLQWQKSIGSSQEDYAYNIQATTNGNFLVTGHSGASDGDAIGNHGNFDTWTVMMDSAGNVLWQKNLGGSMEDVARSCAQRPDGSILVAGYTKSSDGDISGQHGGADAWVGKLCFTSDFYLDNDHDGYGNSLVHITACSAPVGYVADNSDCNDNDISMNPGVTDFCDGIDNNCNGITDENAIHRTIGAAGPTVFCEPGFVVLTIASAGSVDVFKWFRDGFLIPGNTGSSYKATASGSYSALVNNAVCTVATNIVSVTANSLPVVSITPGGTISVCKVATTLTASEGGNYAYQWYNNNVLKPGAINSTYVTDKSEAGDYKVSVTDNNGCSSFSGTTTIVRLNNPSSTIAPAGNLNICNTGSVILQANNGNNFTYKWYKNSSLIQGATLKTYTATAVGDYTVKVMNANGCSKISPVSAVYSSCREEEQVSAEALTAEVYPNPASTIIHVSIQTAQPEVVEVSLCNVLGQQLQSFKVFTTGTVTQLEIPLDKIREEGIHFITLSTTDKRIVRTFLHTIQ